MSQSGKLEVGLHLSHNLSKFEEHKFQCYHDTSCLCSNPFPAVDFDDRSAGLKQQKHEVSLMECTLQFASLHIEQDLPLKTD